MLHLSQQIWKAVNSSIPPTSPQNGIPFSTRFREVGDLVGLGYHCKMFKLFTIVNELHTFWNHLITTRFKFYNPYVIWNIPRKILKHGKIFKPLFSSYAKYNPVFVRKGNQRYPFSDFDSQNKLCNDQDMNEIIVDMCSDTILYVYILKAPAQR